MKKVFHKIVSFCMALLVLLSTVSFTVDSHYCGDILVDSSLFGHVETCGMEVKQQSPLPECNISKKDCCSDEQQSISGQDELQVTFDKITLNQQLFVAAFFHSYNTLFEISEEVTPSLNDYPPPIIVRHIYKLDETYLI
jgi:hypothetical protein